jgi:hypothetical protein
MISQLNFIAIAKWGARLGVGLICGGLVTGGGILEGGDSGGGAFWNNGSSVWYLVGVNASGDDSRSYDLAPGSLGA